MKPTIGRIVHFVANLVEPEQHYPAIITHVWSDTCVNLEVFRKGTAARDVMDTGVKTSVTFDESGTQPYSWHWPEQSQAGAPFVESNRSRT